MINELTLKPVLNRLKGHEFDPFREKLEELRANSLRNLTKEEETVHLYRLQGEVKALTQVLDLVTENRTQGYPRNPRV